MSRVLRSHHLLSPFGFGPSALTLGASSGAAVLACVVLHLGGTMPWIWAALPMVATSLVVFPARVDVGGDGFCVVWLGRSEFVSFHDVRAIGVDARAVCVTRASGRVLRLRVGVPPDDFSKDVAVEIEDLRREMVGLWSSFEQHAKTHGGVVADDAAVNGYRARAFREDDAWSVVEDPSVVPGQRLHAAVTLHRELGDDASARLYEAAAFVANPPLRAAMEKVVQRAASSQQRTPIE